MEQRELDTNKKDKGFTLVELLIVIVILGILATVVVFAVANVTEKAQDNACATERKTLITAFESFKAENPGRTPVVDDIEDYLTSDWPANWTFQASGVIEPANDGKCVGWESIGGGGDADG